MPFWGWVFLIAGLSALTIAAVLVLVRSTHRMRAHEPLHGDPEEIAAPVPLDVAEANSMTERELERERERSSGSSPVR